MGRVATVACHFCHCCSCWGSFLSFHRGSVGSGRGGGGVGGSRRNLTSVQGLGSWTPGRGRSCFCVHCELVFTGDNSGCGLSGVCVSELFNFMFCLYEEIFMHTSPSVYLMLINITLRSSAVVSLESDSFRSPQAISAVRRAFHKAEEKTTAILLAATSP